MKYARRDDVRGVYQPLDWRHRCWSTLPTQRGRCTHYRRPGFLTCAVHNDRERDARKIYLTTSAPELEGVDRKLVELE